MAGPRSANLFSCQQNSLSRRYFAKVTVEDELETWVEGNVLHSLW